MEKGRGLTAINCVVERLNEGDQQKLFKFIIEVIYTER